MRTFTDTIIETFHVVSCYTCGVRFGIESQLHRRVVINAEGVVYCPACGKQSCWLESEDQKRIKQLEQKLKWEMENAERQKKLRESAEASLIATKGVVTKLKTRAKAGVCPCCNRTFKQLASHMAAQHPDFKTEAEPASTSKT